MNITNVHNLTPAFVEAVKLDDYDRGKSDFTVTQLLKPPQVDRLYREHYEELEEDASDATYRLLGTAVHAVLERAAGKDELTERRLYMELDRVNIGGQFDHLDLRDGILTDYKVSSTWSAIFGKEEWVWQLNMLKVIAEANGHRIRKLQIQGIWRDWMKRKAWDDETYPQAQTTIVPIEIKAKAEVIEFMKEAISGHQAETPRPCTKDDQWVRDEKWALMKEGRKSAVKLFDDPGSAQGYLDDYKKKPGDKLSIVHRKGTKTRCEGYCLVKDFCPQYEQENKLTGEVK